MLRRMPELPTVDQGNGEGDFVQSLSAPRRNRRALNLLRRAVNEGWPISDEIRHDAPGMLESIARTEEDPRARIKAIEVLRAMAKDNVDAAVALDRVERLEAGEATENIAFPRMTFGPPNRDGA